MTTTARKTKAKPIAGDHVPVTARDCWATTALFGSIALIAIGLNLFGGFNLMTMARIVQMLFIAWPAYYSLGLLSRMRRGERFETVYSAPSPKLQRGRVTRYKTLAIVMNLIIGAFSIAMINLMQGAHPDAIVVLIVANALCLVSGLFLFLRAEKMSHALIGQISPVLADETLTSVASTRETTAAQANTAAVGSASRAGHWWTDTQAREEAKVTVKR